MTLRLDVSIMRRARAFLAAQLIAFNFHATAQKGHALTKIPSMLGVKMSARNDAGCRQANWLVRMTIQSLL